jgi:predicted nucleotidyltransferase
MLYSDRSIFLGIADNVLNKVKEFEIEKDVKVVFGSTIGSISKGIQRLDSDYDARFLYVSKDNQFVSKERIHLESSIRHRIFDKEDKCNCIAMWEISAFLNFLVEPYIDNGYSYKLIRNILWTFYSPYAYDPYALQTQLLPLLNKSLNVKLEFDFHRKNAYELMDKFLVSNDVRDYLNSIHHFLSLKWIYISNEIPPISIWPLTVLLPYDDKNVVSLLVSEIRVRNTNILQKKEVSTLLPILSRLSDNCVSLIYKEGEISESVIRENIEHMLWIIRHYLLLDSIDKLDM